MTGNWTSVLKRLALGLWCIFYFPVIILATWSRGGGSRSQFCHLHLWPHGVCQQAGLHLLPLVFHHRHVTSFLLCGLYAWAYVRDWQIPSSLGFALRLRFMDWKRKEKKTRKMFLKNDICKLLMLLCIQTEFKQTESVNTFKLFLLPHLLHTLIPLPSTPTLPHPPHFKMYTVRRHQ